MVAEGQQAMTFVYYLAVGYVAATLLTSGMSHGMGLAGFRDVVRSHGFVPASLATPVAAFVTILELAAGGAALAVLLSEEAAARASLLFAVCAVMGVAFALYVRRLLRRPEGITSCGCSPFESPLTWASVVPACALLLASALGLAAAAFGWGRPLDAAYQSLGISVILPLVWGVTLSLIINLLPASVPRLATGERW